MTPWQLAEIKDAVRKIHGEYESIALILALDGIIDALSESNSELTEDQARLVLASNPKAKFISAGDEVKHAVMLKSDGYWVHDHSWIKVECVSPGRKWRRSP